MPPLQTVVAGELSAVSPSTEAFFPVLKADWNPSDRRASSSVLVIVDEGQFSVLYQDVFLFKRVRYISVHFALPPPPPHAKEVFSSRPIYRLWSILLIYRICHRPEIDVCYSPLFCYIVVFFTKTRNGIVFTLATYQECFLGGLGDVPSCSFACPIRSGCGCIYNRLEYGRERREQEIIGTSTVNKSRGRVG